MPIAADELERLLRAAFPEGEVRVEDLAGDGDHYRAHVRDASFAGQSRVRQHQRVYQALQGRMGGELHALALETGVPIAAAPAGPAAGPKD